MAGDRADDVRWLTDDEQRVWRSYLVATSLLQEALARQLQRDAGLPHAYYMILAMLSEAQGRSLRMNQLAAVLRASPSRTSHAVARLEEAGWVRRERSSADGRGQVAVLTDAGWDKVAETAPGHVGAVRAHLLDALTPEQLRQLGSICDAVVAGLDPAHDTAMSTLVGQGADPARADARAGHSAATVRPRAHRT
jgi:DNA-binding MarR family transcriptional regulator